MAKGKNIFLLGVVASFGLYAGASLAYPPAHSGHHMDMPQSSAMSMRASIAEGASVPRGLTTVRINFSPAMTLMRVRLVREGGQNVATRFGPTAPTTNATISFAPLAAGHYRLVWVADMGDHMMSDQVHFTVQ